MPVRLLEKEAKNLLERYGVPVPDRDTKGPSVVKAQLMANNRADMDAISFADTREGAIDIAREMRETEFEGRKPEEVLLEEQIDILKEYYISLLYDTDSRSPTLVFSREGGTGVEDSDASKLPLQDTSFFRFRQFLSDQGVDSGKLNSLASVLRDITECFLEEDARMLEINPLTETEDGYCAVDAMMELEDEASYRHEHEFPDRDVEGGEKTGRERRAEKIDEDDHRGVAGKYTELEGDIAMMLAGGGASLTNMDALIEYGGEPANYTEYGGNPPTEKVYRLSKVIMSKPDLNGLWHVGGTANNTDVLKTMKGFVKALREEKPDYPIVVRRDGPHADEAFELLRETREELDLDMKLFRNDTPMTSTAETLMDMVESGER